ncbi:hypothetical protein Syun_026933 [Stephania yunnanensis]|uniref:Uncharacterized protein n=1 Tax=Stephania yunnanensis TaxID=152371 RepID=A0AAP0HPG8_9MAGN
MTDPAILIPTSLLVIYNTYSLSEFLREGLSVRAWWNTQRMSRIVTTSAWLFGLANVALKLLGLSETVFHVTPKDRDEHGEGAHGAANASRFTFDESPVFVPGTALVMLHVIGLVVGISRWVRNGYLTAWIGEVVCCVWVVASFMPFVKGLVRKGKYGVPWSVVGKVGVLVGLLVTALSAFSLCSLTSSPNLASPLASVNAAVPLASVNAAFILSLSTSTHLFLQQYGPELPLPRQTLGYPSHVMAPYRKTLSNPSSFDDLALVLVMAMAMNNIIAIVAIIGMKNSFITVLGDKIVKVSDSQEVSIISLQINGASRSFDSTSVQTKGTNFIHNLSFQYYTAKNIARISRS